RACEVRRGGLNGRQDGRTAARPSPRKHTERARHVRELARQRAGHGAVEGSGSRFVAGMQPEPWSTTRRDPPRVSPPTADSGGAVFVRARTVPPPEGQGKSGVEPWGARRTVVVWFCPTPTARSTRP